MSTPASSPASLAPEPFASPSGDWHPVAPELAGIRRVTSAIWLLVLLLPAVALAVVAWRTGIGWWWLAAGLAALVGVAWPLWRMVRASAWVAAWGWTERDEDFCVRSGLFIRRLVVVPVGRLQVVKVSAGPLLRAQGLARLELITATVESNAHVPALPADQAAALRDRLIEKSDARGSGL